MADGYKAHLKHILKLFPQPTGNHNEDQAFNRVLYRAIQSLDQHKQGLPFYASEPYDYAFKQKIPESMRHLDDVIPEMLSTIGGLPIWSHPSNMKNVMTLGTLPAILGNFIATLANPNMASEEYSQKFAVLEHDVVKSLIHLVGYPPDTAGGLFTFGGTGAYAYAIKLGLMRVCPEHIRTGIQEDVVIMASEVGHYAKLTTASWLGIGTNQMISIKANHDHAMDIETLDKTVRATLKEGLKIACIILTMGTTDAFGIDPLLEIAELRNQWQKDFGESGYIHLHADAVIGWAWIVFKDYDFDRNPLQFQSETLEALKGLTDKIQHLHLADTIGIDFHKTGYCPYISSLMLVANQTALLSMSQTQDNVPYLFHHDTYHPGSYTLECSRAATGILAAYASMQSLGKKGFRSLLGHSCELNVFLRKKLKQIPGVIICNDLNHGPVTMIRIYPEPWQTEDHFRLELEGRVSKANVLRVNSFNLMIHDRINQVAKSKGSAVISLTSETLGPQHIPVSAIKAYLINPFITYNTLQDFINLLADIVHTNRQHPQHNPRTCI